MATPAKYGPGTWVVWSDPDENNIVQPHAGKVVASTWDENDKVRVYMVEEQDSTTKNGIRLVFVLEEELSPLKAH